jgi:hypothetical protein
MGDFQERVPFTKQMLELADVLDRVNAAVTYDDFVAARRAAEAHNVVLASNSYKQKRRVSDYNIKNLRDLKNHVPYGRSAYDALVRTINFEQTILREKSRHVESVYRVFTEAQPIMDIEDVIDVDVLAEYLAWCFPSSNWRLSGSRNQGSDLARVVNYAYLEMGTYFGSDGTGIIYALLLRFRYERDEILGCAADDLASAFEVAAAHPGVSWAHIMNHIEFGVDLELLRSIGDGTDSGLALMSVAR